MTARAHAMKKVATRGEPVVKDVLSATLAELGHVGYHALRIEDVAVRANVHKTTIYRRWPTKEELVRECLHDAFTENLQMPDTGSLRGDLLVVATQLLEFFSSANGQALVRMMMSESAEGELRKIVDSLRDAKERAPRQMIERAIARGQLPDGFDGELLMTTLVGSLHHAVFARCLAPSQVHVGPLVDLLLYGAVASARSGA
jgi:AcrR family transcriptional regulator